MTYRTSTAIEAAFDREALRRVCEMRERTFQSFYKMTRTEVPAQRAPSNFYLFKDNGARVLAVAHLDTVADGKERACTFAETASGTVVHSRALDDRLGAYIILEMLPLLGVNVDVLLTVGEETGQSTAAYFETEKEYDWMIEFDRGGTDVVMYQYDDGETRNLVRQSGARVGDGIFSDISYMDHLGIKGFNWGVGYQDYHGPRAHAYLEDTWEMLTYYLYFHKDNAGTRLLHRDDGQGWGYGYRSGGGRSKYGSSRYDSGWPSSRSRWGTMDEVEDSFDPADHDPPSRFYGTTVGKALGEPVDPDDTPVVLADLSDSTEDLHDQFCRASDAPFEHHDDDECDVNDYVLRNILMQ